MKSTGINFDPEDDGFRVAFKMVREYQTVELDPIYLSGSLPPEGQPMEIKQWIDWRVPEELLGQWIFCGINDGKIILHREI